MDSLQVCSRSRPKARVIARLASMALLLTLALLASLPVHAQGTELDAMQIPNDVDCCYVDVGDYVWFDMNGNGIQDEPDTAGVNGITVRLLKGYAPNEVLRTTSTVSHNGRPGFYVFTDVPYDRHYMVEFVLPEDDVLAFTQKDQGANDLDSDADLITGRTGRFYLPCENKWTLDAGLVRIDLGDLPEAYPMVTLGENGARHLVWDVSGDAVPDLAGAVWLGDLVDGEANAAHCPRAMSDDERCMHGTAVPGEDDEDGVSFDASAWRPGDHDENYLDVRISGFGGVADAYFAGWVDWNGNGSFDDAADWIVGQTLEVQPAAHHLVFTGPPLDAYAQTLNMRFRLFADEAAAAAVGAGMRGTAFEGTSVPAAPTNSIATAYAGATINGEVEDYQGVNTPLAVTVSYVYADREGETVQVVWQTATEHGVAGFNLLVDGEPVNPALLPSPAIDSVVPIEYRYTVSGQIETYILQEVGVNGRTRDFGPYTVGTAYGSAATIDEPRIDRFYLPLIPR